MNDNDIDTLGPVDYLVVEFPAGEADFSGAMGEELSSLVERGLVRLLDVLLLNKDADGSVEALELHEVEDDTDLGVLRELETDMALLLAEEDIEAIGVALEPGTTAGVLVWENTWAAPFASAVRHSGGQLVASGRIPTQAILGAVESEEQATTEGA